MNALPKQMSLKGKGSQPSSENHVPSPLERWFGSKVKEIRVNQGLSQKELASRTGLSQAYITELERGGRVLIQSIGKLARALEVSVPQLLSNESATKFLKR
jgi:ribosome-binding protein aMBF1 (putative translation factor)